MFAPEAVTRAQHVHLDTGSRDSSKRHASLRTLDDDVTDVDRTEETKTVRFARCSTSDRVRNSLPYTPINVMISDPMRAYARSVGQAERVPASVEHYYRPCASESPRLANATPSSDAISQCLGANATLSPLQLPESTVRCVVAVVVARVLVNSAVTATHAIERDTVRRVNDG